MSEDQAMVNRSRAAWRKLYEDERFAHFKAKAEFKEAVAYYVGRELADLRERNSLLAEIERLQDLIMEMADPTVAWAQACARQAGLQPGEFRADHQELIDRINTALKETVDV